MFSRYLKHAFSSEKTSIIILIMNQENHHTAPIQEIFLEEARESPGDDTIHSPDSLAYPKVYKQRKMRSPLEPMIILLEKVNRRNLSQSFMGAKRSFRGSCKQAK